MNRKLIAKFGLIAAVPLALGVVACDPGEIDDVDDPGIEDPANDFDDDLDDGDDL